MEYGQVCQITQNNIIIRVDTNRCVKLYCSTCLDLAVALMAITIKGNEWQVKPTETWRQSSNVILGLNVTRTGSGQPKKSCSVLYLINSSIMLTITLGIINNKCRYNANTQSSHIRQKVSVMWLVDSGYTIYRNKALLKCARWVLLKRYHNKRCSTVSRGQRMTHSFRGTASLCWVPDPFTSPWHLDSSMRHCWTHVRHAEKGGCVVLQSYCRSTSLLNGPNKVAQLTSVCCMLLNTAKHSSTDSGMIPWRWWWRWKMIYNHWSYQRKCRATATVPSEPNHPLMSHHREYLLGLYKLMRYILLTY